MISVSPNIELDRADLAYRYIRAPGPGGQNVNKVATAVQLRFTLEGKSDLPPDVRARLRALAGNRVNRAGEIVITANRHRSQNRNRDDAEARLVRLIRRALIVPKKRRKTRPSAAARRRRLEAKRRQADKKRARRRGGPGWD